MVIKTVKSTYSTSGVCSRAIALFIATVLGTKVDSYRIRQPRAQAEDTHHHVDQLSTTAAALYLVGRCSDVAPERALRAAVQMLHSLHS